jgi:hypothetical protein
MEEVCMCIKTPKLARIMIETMNEVMMDEAPVKVNEDTGYASMCGKCADPCKLKFMPDMPKMAPGMMGMMPPPMKGGGGRGGMGNMGGMGGMGSMGGGRK